MWTDGFGFAIDCETEFALKVRPSASGEFWNPMDTMESTLGRELVLDAPLMALWRRKRQQRAVHCNQGTQYGSEDWSGFCRANNHDRSMSRRGNCCDNVVAETFLSSAKQGVRKRIHKARELPQAGTFGNRGRHNRSRRHSHLGLVNSEAFERAAS